MPPRKQINKDAFSPGSTQNLVKHDGDHVGPETTDEIILEELPHSSLSLSPRQKRRLERDMKSKPKEMTEEEMMDLALRLSEQEAGIVALKRQQEEEATKKAFEKSMVSQTQRCPSPQRCPANTDTSSKLPSVRKLAYPNATCEDAVLVKALTTETNDLRESRSRISNKRKRERGDCSPLLGMPDLSQSQKMFSQSSLLDSSPPQPAASQSAPLSSSQDIDCVRSDLCQLPQTPVISMTPPALSRKLQVQLSRLSQEVLESCRTSHFVSYSQQSLTSIQTSQPSSSKSPTFPGSTTPHNLVCYKSPAFPKCSGISKQDLGQSGETEPGPNCSKNLVFSRIDSVISCPAFGRTSQNETQLSDYETQIPDAETHKLLATCESLSSQESLASLQHSRQPKSQKYPSSSSLLISQTFPRIPAYSENQPGEGEDIELRHGCSIRAEYGRSVSGKISPVFGKTSPVFGKTSPVFGSTSPVFGSTSTVFGRTSPVFGSTSPVSGMSCPVFGNISPVFGRTRTQLGQKKSLVLAPVTVDRESSSEESCSASSSCGSAIYNQETRQLPQCLHKTNGGDHGEKPSQSSSGEHANQDTPTNPAKKEKQAEVHKESISGNTMTSDMNLRWSDEDEEVLMQSGGSPSPVFPDESLLRQAGGQRHSSESGSPTSPGTTNCRLPGDVEKDGSGGATRLQDPNSGTQSSHAQGPSGRSSARPEQPTGEPLVYYYWGVPFCPKGLDPDDYTQVILSQMEVYEKSLKHAQRSLLRKAEWGQAITPKPEEPRADSPELLPTQRPNLRSGKNKSGENLSEVEEGGEGETEPSREVEEVEAAAAAGDGEEDLDVVGCDVCPETQLSGDDTQELIMDVNAGEESEPGSPSILSPHPTQRLGREEEEDQTEEEEKQEEGEADVRSDLQPEAVTSPSRVQEQRPQGVKEAVEEVPGSPDAERKTERRDRADAGPAVGPANAGRTVDCPICQKAFSTAEIETHAAFCDGEQEVVECDQDGAEYHSPVSLRPLKRRTLRDVSTEEYGQGSATYQQRMSQRREKCYICQKLVVLGEYSRHTENCVQRQRSNITASKGGLLSALKTTESRVSVGPSVSNITRTQAEVIDLCVNDEDDDDSGEGDSGQASTFPISDSPIRAFRSISEAPDSLVDFKQQSSARQHGLSKTRGRRGGGGVKRKLKR